MNPFFIKSVFYFISDADIITISQEQGNEEMLHLAAEAEARVPADERSEY